MKITRTSTMTGKVNTKEIPVTQEQIDKYEEGEELLQNVFPDTTEEWDTIFSKDCCENEEPEKELLDDIDEDLKTFEEDPDVESPDDYKERKQAQKEQQDDYLDNCCNHGEI